MREPDPVLAERLRGRRARQDTARATRHDASIRDALARGERPTGPKQIQRLGRVALTDKSGEPTAAGERARGANPALSLDPWVRGTRVEGNKVFASRQSGREVQVARLRPGTGKKEILKQGEDYHRQNRSEFIIHVPVTGTWTMYSDLLWRA